MKSVFFDLNVILDIFLKREPFYASSAKIFSLVENKRFKGYLSAISYPILFYLLKQGLDQSEAKKILKKVRIVLKTAAVSERTIDSALNSNIRDFEDAVQYYSALEVKGDFLVTRNKKDFPANHQIKVITPDEFLALLKSENAEQNSP